MTLEVKQRIELIQRGEVPEGYKKTKVGIIPAEWETVRFKDKFDRLMRRNGEGNSNVLTISAQHGLISQEDFFNKEVAGEDKSNYFLLHRGEYAYNKSYSNGYPFGAIKRLDRYDAGIVSPLYICFSDGKENRCPEYYLQYFEGGKLNSEIHAFAQEGARNHGLLNISIDDFFNSAIPDPPLHEQQRIVEVLSAQEKVIALLEQKTEQLRQMKKYCLSKMFPKRGENVPEIRFPGFTDAWEQRKLGEVFEQTSNFVNPNDGNIELWSLTVEDGLTPKSERYNREFLVKKDDNFKIVRPGDIVYNPMNMTLGAVGYNGMSQSVAVSGYYTTMVARDNYDSYYINTWLKSPQAILLYKTYATGSLIEKQRVQFPTLSIISVAFPEYEEQKKIGRYFENLDNLITLHQRKRDEENRKKQALMQLLLTGIVRANT